MGTTAQEVIDQWPESSVLVLRYWKIQHACKDEPYKYCEVVQRCISSKFYISGF
jgi:hypothetical protein